MSSENNLFEINLNSAEASPPLEQLLPYNYSVKKKAIIGWIQNPMKKRKYGPMPGRKVNSYLTSKKNKIAITKGNQVRV